MDFIELFIFSFLFGCFSRIDQVEDEDWDERYYDEDYCDEC